MFCEFIQDGCVWVVHEVVVIRQDLMCERSTGEFDGFHDVQINLIAGEGDFVSEEVVVCGADGLNVLCVMCYFHQLVQIEGFEFDVSTLIWSRETE